MTDTPSSPTDPTDDELLASLYLDGEATAEERARVESDPALLARVREYEALAEQLSDVTPPAGLRETQIAAALDVFDQQQPTDQQQSTPVDAAASAPASVSSLADRRERKAASRGLPAWLGAAAALVLVAGGLAFFTSQLDSGGEDTATEAFDTAAEVSPSRSNEESAEAGDDADAAGASAESLMETEAFDDGEAMADEAMADEAMEDDSGEDAADDADDSGENDDSTTTEVPEEDSFNPIPLDDLDATTAADYLALLGDAPRLPIEDAICASGPVEVLAGFESFIPVIFNGQRSSLLIAGEDPAVAVIIGPTCQIELE